MTKKDEQLGKTHFFTKGKFFIVCIIALLLMVAYLFGKSNNSHLEGTNIQEPTPTLEPTETPTQTYIPTPIIIQSNNNSLEEEQKIRNIENCQKQMNDYNSCVDTKNEEYQRYSNCMTQYNIELQSIQDKIARGASLIEPANYCGNPPTNYCSKPNCLY